MTRFETFNDPHAMGSTRVTQVAAAGTGESFTFTRDAATGALIRLAAAGRIYVETDASGWMTFGGGLARVREDRADDAILRDVETPHGDWQERFGFDDDGRLAHVDGVDVSRDDDGRVTACIGLDTDLKNHQWRYSYNADGLTAIQTPTVVRHLSRKPDGRVIACRNNGQSQRYQYDKFGKMRGITPLSDDRYHRDEAGRIWAVTDASGAVQMTYIWDGWRCIGRIDGPPGAPLAAVFNLDPSATPVRIITAKGVIRIPRDAYGEGLTRHGAVPGLFGALQSAGLHHLPWRVLDPSLGAFTAPDPFDGSENDPRRGPDGSFEGDLDIETDRQRDYDVCRNDPISRADPSGGISAGLLISSLTWSFQNNLVTFFGVDWWFNLFGSLFTASNFFSSEGLVSSDHIGAFGVLRDGVIPVITGGRAFTTQHIVWDTKENFDALNDGMLIDPTARFDPPLMGGPLVAAPAGNLAFLLRGTPADQTLNWNRSGGVAEPSFPGASQPVFPNGGFHLATARENVRGPLACPLTETVPGAVISTATAAAEATTQLLAARENTILLADLVPIEIGSNVLLEGNGERLRTRITEQQRWNGTTTGNQVEFEVEDHVPDTLGVAGITLTHLQSTTTSETAQAPSDTGVQGFSARGLTQTYQPSDLLEIRADGGGDDVIFCRPTGPEARLPLNAALPVAMTAPITVLQTTLAPPVSVALDGTDGLDFAGAGTPPASGITGLVSNGTTHIPCRITDVTASPTLRTDTDLSALGAMGTAVTFQQITPNGLLGRRTDAAETTAQITYVPASPGAAPDGSSTPTVVLLSGTGALDAPRLLTGAPLYDAILTDAPLATVVAPWRVERWQAAAAPATIANVWLTEALRITPDAPTDLTGALAIRVMNVDGTGTTPTPGPVAIAGLNMSGATGTFSATAATMPSLPRVSDAVILSSGGTNTVASVTGLNVTFDLDRDVALEDGSANFMVRLIPTGFEWASNRSDDRVVVLSPTVSGVRSQFPRIRDGAAVRVAYTNASGSVISIYRVSGIDGLTLTLDGPDIITADATGLTVQLLEADEPGTGHQRVAINVTYSAAATTRQASADVWSPDAFNDPGTGAGGQHGYGIVSGGRTTPVVIATTTQSLTVRFAADTGVNGPTDLHQLTERQRFDLPVNAAVASPLTLEGLNTDVGTLLLQPFVTSAATAPAAMLHPGTIMIPEEEGVEVTRRQALVDHELVHTEQYHKFGPLWFCYFPLFLLELPVELATDLEQPNFGPSIPAQLDRQGANVTIIPDSDVEVAEGDEIQVLQGGDHDRMTVASVNGTSLVMRGAIGFRAGAVQVRKVQDNGSWPDVLLSIGRIGTHGGLLNTGVGFTWGGLLWLLSKGIYGAIRAIGGAGDQYPGSVIDVGRAIELMDADGQRELNADGQYIIKSGDMSVVRSATRNGTQLVLDQPTDLTGAVQVSAYSSLNPGEAFDWLQYNAGTVDTDNIAAIDLPGKGGDFSVGDRIEYIYLDRSGRTNITAVTGDRIEVEDPIALTSGETSIRVALLAEANTTLGSADEAALNWMGMGWMRLLFDPYGQIEARVGAQETWQIVLLRVMRVLLGSRNFSVLPLLGYVFHSRLLTFLPWTPPEHRATIEQDASEKSGDLYSPMSRLNGQLTRDDRYDPPEMTVGDIARFRYWEWTGARALTSVDTNAAGASMGAPGVHYNSRETLRVIAFRSRGTAFRIPNQRSISRTAGGTAPASALPDRFYTKNTGANLGDVPGTDPVGMAPSDLGVIPLSPTLIRNPSSYVAFTRPGNHRATLANNNVNSLATGLADGDDLSQALDAQQNDQQNIWFNITARDVTVQINGADVAEGDTVTLVQTQTARLTVTPPATPASAQNVYRATVPSPATSSVLKGAAPLRLIAQGDVTTSPEPVEVSRFYDFDEDAGSFVDPTLARFGMHLASDLDIPVRQFSVTVVDTLPLRATAAPTAAEVTTLAQGDDAFLLVPTNVNGTVTYTVDGAASSPTDPVLVFETVTTPAVAADTIGPLGEVRRVHFPTALALAASVDIVIAIPVLGEDGSTGLLNVSFTLDPPP